MLRAASRPPLTLYQRAPDGEMTLDQFEGAALDRLCVLDMLDRRWGMKDGKLYVDNLIRQRMPLLSEEDARRDSLSHWVLHLAFCRPKDRFFFVKNEVALFEYRLKELDPTAAREFIKTNGMTFGSVSEEQYERIKKDVAVLYSEGSVTPLAHELFRVRWTEALAIIKRRDCLLDRGYAVIHRAQVIPIIVSRFRAFLAQELDGIWSHLPEIMQGFPSLAPLLESLRRRDVTPAPSLSLVSGVSAADLDSLAATRFPACMQNYHKALRKEHHLQYDGRLRYGLFLKHIGLSLDEALRFWRWEFTHKMTERQFEASHAYNIRHLYGKEGKAAQYKAFGCAQLVKEGVCPYSVFSSVSRQACGRELVQHYPQIKGEVEISHPNQYFIAASGK